MPDSWRAIGIDVGGTKIAGGVVDATGAVTALRVRPTASDRPQASLETVVDLIAELDADAAQGALPLGVAVPELVDHRGEIASSATLDWVSSDLRATQEGRTVVVEADAHAAALAEARFGAARGAGTAVYLSLGTGISSSLLIDGHPQRGRRGFTGFVGSGPLMTHCARCGSLTSRALEDFASGAALVARAAERGLKVNEARELFGVAEAGDGVATSLVEDSAAAIGGAVALLINLCDPDVVVVGGGLRHASPRYWDLIVTAARAGTWAPGVHPPITPSLLGEAVGVVGAALRTQG